LKVRANLTLVETNGFAEKQRVGAGINPAGRKSDQAYGRADHKFLTEHQCQALIKTAKRNRYGLRDSLAISLCWHHGLRVSELVKLSWDSVDLKAGTIHVKRLKNGRSGQQLLASKDLKGLRALKTTSATQWVFVSERGGHLTPDGFSKLLASAGKRAGIDRRLCHPHALRHACGHVLADQGRVTSRQIQEILGHRNFANTQIYVEGVSGKIRGLWD
jgi:site-specific recombinase XerD